MIIVMDINESLIVERSNMIGMATYSFGNNLSPVPGGDAVAPQLKRHAVCPFVSRPFEECYCMSTSSLFVESTVEYCGGNFTKCEIYSRNMPHAQ